MSGVRVLVVAKAPVAGRVKTRLGAEVGHPLAAAVAAASLLDTLDACAGWAGATARHLALAGHLAGAVRGTELVRAADRWTVTAQVGAGLGERLAHAHAELPGPVVQVGMDTPQVTAGLLAEVAAGLGDHDAVLGPADDGGWWVLALRDPSYAAALVDVEMSAPSTGAATRAALEARGLRVATAPVLRDVDTVADAHAVAAAAPGTRFARLWCGREAAAG